MKVSKLHEKTGYDSIDVLAAYIIKVGKNLLKLAILLNPVHRARLRALRNRRK